MSLDQLKNYLETISKDLDRSMKFWFSHSHDVKHGGFYTCLGKDGNIYDTLKYCWLQGRQVWTYAWLYNECDRFRKKEVLDKAIEGADFLLKYVKKPDNSGKCYFLVTEDGQPVKTQRTIFSEVFYTMAMSELARATGEDKYKTEATSMMKKIVHWVQKDDSVIGREKLVGQAPTNNMGVWMMICCLIDQIQVMEPELADQYRELTLSSIQKVLAHIQRDGTRILENVSLDGKELPGFNGRLMNPGHAIECGWFLLRLAQKQNDSKLQDVAIKSFIESPFQYGWDDKYGGIYAFLDADGLSPTQLEWNMKLWWAHNEAMIAFLMAYKATRDQKHLDNFAKVFNYSYKHFVDTDNGEWYGYLNQQGQINNDFKGGLWKGCFHVPRCLWMCERLLHEIIEEKKS